MRNDAFNTATMAKLFVDQGHFDKAAEIYRALLEKYPQNSSYAEALADIESKLVGTDSDAEQRLSRLISQWITLSIRYKRVQHLVAVKKRLLTP